VEQETDPIKQLEKIRKELSDMQKSMIEEEKSTGQPAMMPGELFFMMTGLILGVTEALAVELIEERKKNECN